VLLLPVEGQLVLSAAFPPEDRLEAIEQAAARWAFDHNQPAGRGSDTLTASEWLFHPLAAGGRALGVFGLANADAGAPIRSDQLPLLLSLLDQAALALERIALESEMATSPSSRSAIGCAPHCSPRSATICAPRSPPSSACSPRCGPPRRAGGQLTAARGEAERLHRFVANLLDMVRIEAGALHQSIEPVDLPRRSPAAVHDLRRVLGGHPIQLDVSPDLPLVSVDPQLFHHCLINLLENAAKYGDAGAPITIAARRQPAG
jgi:two-component system sensor histidine kinase KdpD